MKNLKVRSKMLLGFMIITIIGILIGVVGIVSILMIRSDSEDIMSLQASSNGASNVLNAHYIWRQGLTEAVLTGGDFTGSLDPTTCALGKWLASDEAKSITDPTVLDLLRQIEAPHTYIHTEAGNVVGYIQAGRMDEAKTDLVSNILPKTQEVIGLLTQVQDRFATLINQDDQKIVELETRSIYIVIGIIIVAAILSILMALYISSLISKPLIPMSKFFEKAGTTGDLALGQEEQAAIAKYSQSKDELGQLTRSAAKFVAKMSEVSEALRKVSNGDISLETNVLTDQDTMGLSLKYMLDNLNNMFTEIHASTDQVSSGSKQVADGAQSLAQGSTEQAASIEELSSSIAEIAEKTKTNAMTADKTAKLSETIKESAEKGSRQMDEMITAVGEINEASKNISKIIKTIDDIAFQTNILALNAAVEAARAGSAGKGFAVVAEEVRNLASKSAEAAKDTGNMIQNSMEKAELGSQIAGETAASLNEIVSGVKESSQLIAEIAKASEEQSLGIEQINIGIDQVAQVVQQNSATAEESAAASEEMSGQSDLLQQLLAQFRLREGNSLYASLPAAEVPAWKRPAMPEKSDFALSDSGKEFGKY